MGGEKYAVVPNLKAEQQAAPVEKWDGTQVPKSKPTEPVVASKSIWETIKGWFSKEKK